MTDPANLTAKVPPRRGFFANVGSLVFARGFMAVSQILILPILARYLSVEEFALMALAMTVVIFAGVMSDAGLGRSLIRTPAFDRDEWSTVFWLLVSIGILLCGAILVAAPVWAWAFGMPALWPVLSALSLVPLFQAVSAAPNAEIERREDYASIARWQLIAALGGLAVAAALAVAGAGVWALVVQQLILAGVRLVGILHLSQFRAALVFRRSLVGPHLKFARDTVATSLVAVAQGQTATVAIGTFLGAGPLGVFAMSQRFTRLPQFGLAGPMSAVVYVRMAKAQESPDRLVAIYLAATRLLASILGPALAMIAVCGPAVFTLLLSDKWAPVAPVFAFTIPGIVLEAATITCLVCMFRALGRTDLQVRLVLEGALLGIPLVVIAAFVSVEAVGGALSLWALLYVLRGWRIAAGVVPLRLASCLGALAWPVGVSAVAVLAHVAAVSHFDPGRITEVLLAMMFTFVAYGALMACNWKDLKSAVNLFR